MSRKGFMSTATFQNFCLALALVSIVIGQQAKAQDFVTNCNPTMDCAGMSAGDKVPDPADCTQYYVCIERLDGVIEPSDVPVPCPEGEFFSPTSLVCLVQIGEFCQNDCLNLGCNIACTNYNYELTLNPNDCSSYYECLPGGSKLEMRCEGSTPYFKGDGCSGNIYNCCEYCTPYCKIAGTEVVDPTDCHYFYICTEDDTIPSESMRFQCETGYFFDSSSGDCEEEGLIKCSSLCET